MSEDEHRGSLLGADDITSIDVGKKAELLSSDFVIGKSSSRVSKPQHYRELGADNVLLWGLSCALYSDSDFCSQKCQEHHHLYKYV